MRLLGVAMLLVTLALVGCGDENLEFPGKARHRTAHRVATPRPNATPLFR
jgi:hypothetical protein